MMDLLEEHPGSKLLCLSTTPIMMMIIDNDQDTIRTNLLKILSTPSLSLAAPTFSSRCLVARQLLVSSSRLVSALCACKVTRVRVYGWGQKESIAR